MSKERFDLISRYITAANDVIDICGADALETLQVLLQAAHAEAVKGLAATAATLQASPSMGAARPVDAALPLN